MKAIGISSERHHLKRWCKLSVHFEINAQGNNNEMDCEIYLYCFDFDCQKDVIQRKYQLSPSALCHQAK